MLSLPALVCWSLTIALIRHLTISTTRNTDSNALLARQLSCSPPFSSIRLTTSLMMNLIKLVHHLPNLKEKIFLSNAKRLLGHHQRISQECSANKFNTGPLKTLIAEAAQQHSNQTKFSGWNKPVEKFITACILLKPILTETA